MVAIYGEEDVRSASQMRRRKRNVRVSSKNAMMCSAYAGNLAWAHLVASQALRKDPALGGEVYIITDDTPVMSRRDLVGILAASGGTDSVSDGSISIPPWVLYAVLALIMLVSYAISPVYNLT